MRRAVKLLVDSIDDITFDITSHELKYGEQLLLFDAYANLKFARDDRMRQLNFKNPTILVAMENKARSQATYIEDRQGNYDPLKPRIMGALANALTRSDLHEIHQVQQNDVERQNQAIYPYTPDMVLGYHG